MVSRKGQGSPCIHAFHRLSAVAIATCWYLSYVPSFHYLPYFTPWRAPPISPCRRRARLPHRVLPDLRPEMLALLPSRAKEMSYQTRASSPITVQILLFSSSMPRRRRQMMGRAFACPPLFPMLGRARVTRRRDGEPVHRPLEDIRRWRHHAGRLRRSSR